MRAVAVFDADLPPGVAFIRSLGRAGVPVTVFTTGRLSPGSRSRHAAVVRSSPLPHHTDDFVAWLVGELEAGSIDLVAPTSDQVTFCVSEALEKVGRPAAAEGYPEGDALRSCLFKYRFARALGDAGFPTPTTAAALTVEEALLAADEIGYPVVVKPRTHVGVGRARGLVAANPDELAGAFVPYDLGARQSLVLGREPNIALPLVQRYYEIGTVDVVSVTGCLTPDGEVLGLGHCRKVSQSPRRLGVGTMFEPVPPQPFSEAAVRAVGAVLGTGLFELEVLVDRATGEASAVDLNPRAFGQMSLDIALGNDLPALWYRSVTGAPIEGAPARRPAPAYWHEALSSYVGLGVRILRGGDRSRVIRHAFQRVRAPSVRAMFEWDDPVPGALFGLAHLRHPRSFLRPFFVDTERAEAWPERAPAPDRPAPSVR